MSIYTLGNKSPGGGSGSGDNGLGYSGGGQGGRSNQCGIDWLHVTQSSADGQTKEFDNWALP